MSAVGYELRDDVVRLAWDDGKANSVSSPVIAELEALLDRAAEEGAKAVSLTGRPGRFCAGFDLGELGQGGDTTRRLVRAGAELLVRIYELPIPVVVGCSGHALGLGALLLLAADARIGAPGSWKIGLNEVAISLALPTFGTELASARLSRRHLTRAAQHAEIYDPAGAVDAGFLDLVCDEGRLDDAVAAEAGRLGTLAGPAFAVTKQRLHAATIGRIRASLDVEF
jgi:enoyl-CoA hydratase